MSTLTKAERDKLPESAFGDPKNRLYPILDQSDVDGAAHLIGKANDPEAVKKRILAICKRLGLNPPDAWVEGKKEDMRDENEIEYKALHDSRTHIDAEANDGYGRIEGYAAVFGNKDRVGDIIVKGAFLRTIPQFKESGVILARHGKETTQPIATPDDLFEDTYGLKYIADYHSTDFAQQERTIAQERLARKKSVSNSIGYLPAKGGAEIKADARYLRDIDLYEITTNVNTPANPKAVVTAVKDMGLSDGLTFTDHLIVVSDAISGLRLRVEQKDALLLKQGRVFSGASRGKITDAIASMRTCCDDMEAMLAEADASQPEDVSPMSANYSGEMMKLYADFLIKEALLDGVLTT